MRILTLLAQKGGTGKTTLSILTLDSDPLESNSTPPPTPPDEEEIKEAVKTTPEKESSLLRTIIFAGLTIASLIVFKRKLF